jgi:hypothetical protein
MYKNAGMEPPHPGKGIHTKKFHKCVTDVGEKGKVDNPQAVCMASLGKEKAVKKSHQREGIEGGNDLLNYIESIKTELNLLDSGQKIIGAIDTGKFNDYFKTNLEKGIDFKNTASHLRDAWFGV